MVQPRRTGGVPGGRVQLRGLHTQVDQLLAKVLAFEQAQEAPRALPQCLAQWFPRGRSLPVPTSVPSSFARRAALPCGSLGWKSSTFMRLISMSAGLAMGKRCAVVAGDHAAQGDAAEGVRAASQRP